MTNAHAQMIPPIPADLVVALPPEVDDSPVGKFAAAYRERLALAEQARTDLVDLFGQEREAVESDDAASRAAVIAGEPDPGTPAHDDLYARLQSAERTLEANIGLLRELQAALVDALAGDPGAAWAATTAGIAAELGAKARKLLGKARTDAEALVDKITEAERIAAWVRGARDDAGQGYLAGTDSRPAQPLPTLTDALGALRVLEHYPHAVPAPEPEPVPASNALVVHLAARAANHGELPLLRRQIEKLTGSDPGFLMGGLAAEDAMRRMTQAQVIAIRTGEV